MKTRHIARLLLSAAPAALALCTGPTAARAQASSQVDTNPKLPNVLLLLDTSGSMERMIDGTLPEASPATACNVDPLDGHFRSAQSPLPNRWAIVQQALTGTLANGFNCVAMPRMPNTRFTDEYQINRANPYDTNYYLPFHRMVARDVGIAGCVVAPGTLPGANTPAGVGISGLGSGGQATGFAGGIVRRPYGTAAATDGCKFDQLNDGAIPTMTQLMRFGLMTFDQDPSPKTGVDALTMTVANPAFDGMWTYFKGWNGPGALCDKAGKPVDCDTMSPYAVGARNSAAPPWEGRMVGFPSKDSDQSAFNGQVSDVVLASRPYGGTPLAGMFTDAQFYLRDDSSGPQQTDPFIQGGCRNEYIIVLTDGVPNQDLRQVLAANGTVSTPGCDTQSAKAKPGVCPFAKPEEIAASLYNHGSRIGNQQFVKTYVIGFAVSSFQDQGQTVNCSSLAANGTVSATCSDPAKQATFGACCELQKIAVNGGSNQAYFADTPGDLQKALGAILADIAKQATTRTTPAYSPVLTSAVADPTSPRTNASTFLASFNPSPGMPWSGDLQRQRYSCDFGSGAFSVKAPPITAAVGDDFAQNLNSGSGPRTFIALQPDVWASTARADASQTIRPFVKPSVGDQLGRYSATAHVGQASVVAPSITPDALGIQPTGCQYTPTGGGPPAFLTPAQCRDMVLDFTLGQPFSGPSNFQFVSRVGNGFGDIFHATPIVVAAPGSLLQDPSYTLFRAKWNAVPATSGRGTASGSTKPRDPIVYAATNDGLLHAFWADETKLENNEEWAMILPAVMPNLLSSYPSSHKFLLDGSPIVRDVVWERTGVSDATVWHTMLVAGFGPSQQGYYAVDVTNPDAAGLASASALSPPGPQFRWQLTKMPATNYPVFADLSATPAITTLFFDPGDGNGKREIGVAILPGGVDKNGPGGKPCSRLSTAWPAAPVDFPARTQVRCWGTTQASADVVRGRSLTIARVDTGEVLRVFARRVDVKSFPTDTLDAAGRYTYTPLDSPMTGTPVVYPSDVGTAATEAFVGDEDGTIWRFDLSSADPSKWVGELYLDAYNTAVDKGISASPWADGRPFQVPLVASVDTAGQLVLNAATGSTETFDSTGYHFVYSVAEKVQGSPARLRASVNWWFGPNSNGTNPFRPGERVSGPMTVFNGTLYFASFFAGDPTAQACSGGSARLWGFDFVRPKDTNCSNPASVCDRSQGGVRELKPSGATAAPDFVDPTSTGAPAGAVIPGVSVRATPACASLGTPGADSYVPGGTHAPPQNMAEGSFSLFTQVGAQGGATANGGATAQVSMSLPTPISPTVIDSWAAVLE